MKVPDGLAALNFTQDDVHTLVQGALPQVQLLTSDYVRLLNKPYGNEVTLKRQNPPLKCC